MSVLINDNLQRFLTDNADSLDTENTQSDKVIAALGAAGLLHKGVPSQLGGDDSSTSDAVLAIAAVAQYSLAAAFMFWGQRAFIEYLLQSPNLSLQGRWLPSLLKGEYAGATGLSNAMKFLSGIESLRVIARSTGPGQWILNGDLLWATNVNPTGFIVALAVQREDGRGPMIAALPSNRAGLKRSADLDLIALRGSNTASLQIEHLDMHEEDMITSEARAWLPRVRPAFLALQCGLSIGLTRAALTCASAQVGQAKSVLQAPIAKVADELDLAVAQLLSGLEAGAFVLNAPELFKLRIGLADLVQRALQLELLASGGRAYHKDQPLQFARRWRESAFIPIVTPSLSQLHGELNKHSELQARIATAGA